MTIHVLDSAPTPEERAEMLAALGTYVKLAVDIETGRAAGGGAFHVDCEEALLAAGSRQGAIWGADWLPESHTVRFEALINIRPHQGNRTLEIQNPAVRARVETIVRGFFEGT